MPVAAETEMLEEEAERLGEELAKSGHSNSDLVKECILRVFGLVSKKTIKQTGPVLPKTPLFSIFKINRSF